MIEDSVTLTHFMVEGFDRGFATRVEADRAVEVHRGRAVTEESHTYRVGDQVEVHAYGAWRPGEVVSLKRVRVVVHFRPSRRRRRTLARAFYGAYVRPRGEGSWAQN